MGKHRLILLPSSPFYHTSSVSCISRTYLKKYTERYARSQRGKRDEANGSKQDDMRVTTIQRWMNTLIGARTVPNDVALLQNHPFTNCSLPSFDHTGVREFPSCQSYALPSEPLVMDSYRNSPHRGELYSATSVMDFSVSAFHGSTVMKIISSAAMKKTRWWSTKGIFSPAGEMDQAITTDKQVGPNALPKFAIASIRPLSFPRMLGGAGFMVASISPLAIWFERRTVQGMVQEIEGRVICWR